MVLAFLVCVVLDGIWTARLDQVGRLRMRRLIWFCAGRIYLQNQLGTMHEDPVSDMPIAVVFPLSYLNISPEN